MKIAILGAGLAGSIASGALASLAPVVFEAKPEGSTPVDDHYAVMRIRSPDVGKYLGCELKEIKAHKWVLWRGSLLDKCSPVMNNLYSFKAYDGLIAYRSIMDLGAYTRYLLPTRKFSLGNVRYGDAVFKIGKGWLQTTSTLRYECDVIISTLPMHVNLRLAGKEVPDEPFLSSPLFINTVTLKTPTDVYQTIYVPELEYNTCRMTLSGGTVIFEGSRDYGGNLGADECKELLEYFALSTSDVKTSVPGVQQNGKLIPINDNKRRSIIMMLTDEFKLYSFGRFATWRSIRTDHLVTDIDKIKRLIMVADERRQYEGRLA